MPQRVLRRLACEQVTTTQSDIDRGIVDIQVGFTPHQPVEFVIINIQQKTAAAAQPDPQEVGAPRAESPFTLGPRSGTVEVWVDSWLWSPEAAVT